MVFATQLRQINPDKTLPANPAGTAKTIYAATRMATNYTAGRYEAYKSYTKEDDYDRN
jgi:hypothetical protein